MGRYKDYREPKRRGFDDDYIPQDRIAARRPNNQKPGARAHAPPGSEPVEAIVKWFNPEKGFGFVTIDGAPDAFLHVRLLEAAGHSSLPEGTRVKVRIGPGQKGPQVSELIERVKATPRQSEMNEIRIPGERAFRSRERALREGIEIDRLVYEALARLHP